MNNSNIENGNKVRWAVYLAIGLLVESCCLGTLLLSWLAAQGLPVSTIFNVRNAPTIMSTSPTATPPVAAFFVTPTFEIPTPALSIPTDSVLQASETPFPVPTLVPQLPEFEILPPGKIVFTCFDGRFDQICLMDATGENRRQLTFEDANSFYASLSPDGETIVFSSNRDGNFEIYMMDVRGRDLVRLTNNITGNAYAPEISPKGNRIVFTAESGGVQQIWVMKIDGSNPHPLFESSGMDIDPTWSPDALQVAFASAASGNTLLYIANLTKDNVYLVMRDEMAIGGRSSWSPDGIWLAFYSGQRGDRNIYIVSPQGGGLQQLTFGGDNLGPSFSPDSQWIAFTSYRDGNNEIYILHLNDMKLYRITVNTTSDWQPRWGP